MNNENIFHVIKDPVHGTMQFTSAEDNWIKPFINSPNFQRLRHIKQLGMGDFIFPGAVHTRFNHCLGCCYVASQIAHKIGLPKEDRQLVMIACLLHDVGHGPFSHAFEDVFHQKMIRHEAWTPFFLADFRSSEFFAEYNKINPKQPLSEEKFLLIEEMIMHKSPPKRILSDIVSSQLDADRLDYLLRDSHFCGVKYGEFDLRWMLHCMTIVKTKHGERLGLTNKGIGAVEHYLMARRLMTRNIYHNHKKLAFEFFLIKLLSSLAESIDSYGAFADIRATRIGKFLTNANLFNQKVHAASNTEQLKQDFLKENFSDYKELCDYDLFAIIRSLSKTNDNHPAAQLAKRLQNRQMPKIVRLGNTDIQLVRNELAAFKEQHKGDLQDWQLAIIKTPHQSYSIEDDPILIEDEQEVSRPLNEISLMINAISDKLENTAFLCVDSAIAQNPNVEKFIKNL